MMRRDAAALPGKFAAAAAAAAVLATGLAAATPAAAQAAPEARRGLEIARAICAGCHAVERGNLRSINPDAPAFAALAASPATSAPALHAMLQSPHRRMPDIMLAPADRAAVVAYILGLRDE